MPGTFSPTLPVRDPDKHHGTCVTHVPWSGSLTSGFLWSRWRGKRPRYSRRMCNPNFYVSGKRPIEGQGIHILFLNRSQAPIQFQNVNSCWPIVTSLVHEAVSSYCDVTVTDCSHVFSLDAFLPQWRWGQWIKEIARHMSVRPHFNIIEIIFEPWIMALIILQRRGIMCNLHDFGDELIRNPAIWSVYNHNFVN